MFQISLGTSRQVIKKSFYWVDDFFINFTPKISMFEDNSVSFVLKDIDIGGQIQYLKCTGPW